MALPNQFRMEINIFRNIPFFNEQEPSHMQKQIFGIIIGSALQLLVGPGCQPADKRTEPVHTGADKQSILALVYQQQAAEYRALCLQSYNLAKRRVVESIGLKKGKELPLAVV